MLPDFTYCGAAAGNRQSRRTVPRRRYYVLALLLVAAIAKEIPQEAFYVEVIAFFQAVLDFRWQLGRNIFGELVLQVWQIAQALRNARARILSFGHRGGHLRGRGFRHRFWRRLIGIARGIAPQEEQGARRQDGNHGDGGKDTGHPAVFPLSPTALIRVIVRRHRLILLLAILLLTVLLLAILPAGLLIVLLVILLVVGTCIELPRLILRLLRAREILLRALVAGITGRAIWNAAYLARGILGRARPLAGLVSAAVIIMRAFSAIGTVFTKAIICHAYQMYIIFL